MTCINFWTHKKQAGKVPQDDFLNLIVLPCRKIAHACARAHIHIHSATSNTTHMRYTKIRLLFNYGMLLGIQSGSEIILKKIIYEKHTARQHRWYVFSFPALIPVPAPNMQVIWCISFSPNLVIQISYHFPIF
jgi:hypothetical protein